MRNVLIVDVETTGLDREKDQVIELGCILWSVKHRSLVEVYSRVLPCEDNPAQAVNGIPAALLREVAFSPVWDGLLDLAAEADAVCAHQADFDSAFVGTALSRLGDDALLREPISAALSDPWICTREDMTWPKTGAGESLIATALAHGVAVTSAHRAIHDCLLLGRLFEAVPDIGERLEAAYEHAKLPKVRLVSLAPFEEKDIVKDHGFKWDPQRREWWRVMAVQDSLLLPFKVRQVSPCP